MFDYVKCERVMPDGFDGHGHEFQTKHFDCNMVEWRISEEGRLMQPLRSDGDGAGLFDEVTAYRDSHFHGWLNFYTHVSTGPRTGVWHGYNAKFTDGQLMVIEPDERTAQSAASHADNLKSNQGEAK